MARAIAKRDANTALWKGEWLADFEPFNIEVEQQLLGLALVERSSIAFMRAEISPADFYDPLHQRIFERIFAKHDANRPATPVTLHASLKKDPGLLELECGGLEYFSRCTYFATGVTPAWGSQGSLGSLQAIVRDLARQIVELKARRDATEALRDSFELLRQKPPRPAAILRFPSQLAQTRRGQR